MILQEPNLTLITPELAKFILKNNRKNRSISEKTVSMYATDMKTGNWDQYTLEPIVVNSNGELENGQHRLLACIKANTPFYALLLQNQHESRNCYDRGRPRSTYDALRIKNGNDVTLTKNTISLIRFIFEFGFSIVKSSDSMIEQYWKGHKDTLRKALICTEKQGGHKSRLTSKVSIEAAAYASLRCGVKEESLKSFFAIANSGFPNETWQTTPIMLRNKLQEIKAGNSLYLGFSGRKWLHAYTELAIRDFMNGTERRKEYKINFETFKYPYFTKMLAEDKSEIFEILGRET